MNKIFHANELQCPFCKKECKKDKSGNLYDDMIFTLMSHSATCMPYRRSKEKAEVKHD